MEEEKVLEEKTSLEEQEKEALEEVDPKEVVEEIKKEEKEKKAKKKISTPIIIIIVLVIAIIALILLIVILKTHKKEDTPSLENQITIKFDADGGAIVKDITTNKDEDVKLPKTLKQGYKFIGWYQNDKKLDDTSKFSEDTTLVAKWEKLEETKTFTINFNSNGGTKVKSITQECYTPVYLDIESPERNYYYFYGWNIRGTNQKYTRGMVFDCEDVTFEANWEHYTAILSFYNRLGSQWKDYNDLRQEIPCEGSYKAHLPEPPKEDGYTFIGWKTSDGKTYKDGDTLTCESFSFEALFMPEVKNVDPMEPVEPEEEQKEIEEPKEQTDE